MYGSPWIYQDFVECLNMHVHESFQVPENKNRGPELRVPDSG